MWHISLTSQVYVGKGPLFYGPAILLHILKTIFSRKLVLGMTDQCHSEIDLVNCMWASDLYFMVH